MQDDVCARASARTRNRQGSLRVKQARDWSPIVFGEADPPPLSDVGRKALQKAIREQCETFYSYSRARAILTVAVRLSNVADGQRVLRETRGRWDTNRLSPTWEWSPTSGSERIRCDEFRLGSFIHPWPRIFQRADPSRQPRDGR